MASALDKIAARVGVSRATVARVLNSNVQYRRKFYADRAARIRRVADELNYRPNAAARAVSVGRFGTVCVLCSGLHGSGVLSPPMLAGITDRATDCDIMVQLTRLPDETLVDDAKLPPVLRSVATDGILVNYTHGVPPELEDILAAQDMPVVWLNNKRPNNCVYFADDEAFQQVTEHLLELGHRRIDMVSCEDVPPHGRSHYSTADRQAGYVRAMQAAGLPPRIHEPRRTSDLDMHEDICAVFRAADRPTAVVTTGHGDAVAGAAYHSGLDIPRDMSICTVSRYYGALAGVPVALLSLPDRQLGSRALDILLQAINAPDHSHAAEAISIPLTRGEYLLPPNNRSGSEP